MNSTKGAKTCYDVKQNTCRLGVNCTVYADNQADGEMRTIPTADCCWKWHTKCWQLCKALHSGNEVGRTKLGWFVPSPMFFEATESVPGGHHSQNITLSHKMGKPLFCVPWERDAW